MEVKEINYQKLADQIIEGVEGKRNIKSLFHYSTRLRFAFL